MHPTKLRAQLGPSEVARQTESTVWRLPRATELDVTDSTDQLMDIVRKNASTYLSSAGDDPRVVSVGTQ